MHNRNLIIKDLLKCESSQTPFLTRAHMHVLAHTNKHARDYDSHVKVRQTECNLFSDIDENILPMSQLGAF